MLNEINLARVDLNLLVLFEAVLREQHVGRAATRLHVTPSAVSHGLGRLRRLLADPLFLKHPRGVVPTARALEIAPAIEELLEHARLILASVEPFDPARSRRRFTLGAPDAIAAVMLPSLLRLLGAEAPGIEVGLHQVLPGHAIEALDARRIDVAIVDAGSTPPRVASRFLYADQFVVAARRAHPYLRRAVLDHYCELQHLVVSTRGELHGFVDDALARRRRQRRVVLAVPDFMLGLAVLASTDLLAVVPRSLVVAHGERFGVVASELPLSLPPIQVCVLAPAAALRDAGVEWLTNAIARATPTALSRTRNRARARS